MKIEDELLAAARRDGMPPLVAELLARAAGEIRQLRDELRQARSGQVNTAGSIEGWR
jgi:hypothetical protein